MLVSVSLSWTTSHNSAISSSATPTSLSSQKAGGGDSSAPSLPSPSSSSSVNLFTSPFSPLISTVCLSVKQRMSRG